ncbi:MAG TPA: hypothetical protein VFS17_08175 [Methylophilaceae bacterium]|nr:hypothetical protein [Methylophilaceae bacterium]
MKKLISCFLVFWLPLFVSTAGYASTQMQRYEMQAQAASAIEQTVMQDDQMPEHCSMHMDNNGHMDSSSQDQPSKHASHGSCDHCGFCLNLGFYPVAAIADLPYFRHTLGGNIAWVPTTHLTPAELRPPIAS